MAKLVPTKMTEEAYLDSVEGWLNDDDPFFVTIDDIVASRVRQLPRVLDRGRPQNAKLLEALDEAHANGPTTEEIERRRAWKRQHRRRISNPQYVSGPGKPPRTHQT